MRRRLKGRIPRRLAIDGRLALPIDGSLAGADRHLSRVGLGFGRDGVDRSAAIRGTAIIVGALRADGGLCVGRSHRHGGRRPPVGKQIKARAPIRSRRRTRQAIGALSAEAVGVAGAFCVAAFAAAALLVRVVVVRVGQRKHDLRRFSFGWIGVEQLRSLDPPLAGAKLADVGNVAGSHREPVEDRGILRVRVVSLDADVDAADPPAAPFADLVDQIQLARLLEKA